jgi:uncharacterized protein (TIGR03643 family)
VAIPKHPADPVEKSVSESPASPETNVAAIARIIEMAWEDRTPFEAIQIQFGLDESAVVALMRQQLKASSFRMWRQRVRGRSSKHAAWAPEQAAGEFRHRANNRSAAR